MLDKYVLKINICMFNYSLVAQLRILIMLLAMEQILLHILGLDLDLFCCFTSRSTVRVIL